MILRRLLRALRQYLVFFLPVAFVITCCLMLFVTTLSESLDLTLTRETLSAAAKITLINVLFISLLFTAIDAMRRHWTVERPVRQITQAAENMMRGNFDIHIPLAAPFATDASFNRIIDCFNQMAKELSGVETLRNDFIANASHEMKTPMAVIQNYATLLSAPNLEEARRLEYAQAITDACRRLSDMTTNILKLNRLENQQIYPKTENYDLGEQLCECLLPYESTWEHRGMEIETELAEDVTVCADRELLSLCWNNLLSNAFKFTPDGGTVSLRLCVEGEWAAVCVRDTGCGMTAEVGAHIFEKFYQGDSSRATQGNGLGLALVKRVVDILGGEISVESAPGMGAAFTVRIRRAEHENE